MAKSIAKITVRCPHCSAEQQEPELVKSTFCRKCSEYFAISPSTLAGGPPVPVPAPIKTKRRVAAVEEEPAPLAVLPVAAPEPHAGVGLLHKIDGLFSGRPKHRIAQCFECNSAHEVSGTAHSSTCKACGAYIDMEDHKINGSFSRNIKTRGDVYVGVKGDLSSSKIICRDAVVHGKMRGNLLCSGRLSLKVQGRVAGTVETAELLVEKGSEVTFSRPVKLGSAEIHGKVSGQFTAEHHITVFRHGMLEGPVSASGFTVEKGGAFEGELTISPRRAPAEDRVVEKVETAPATAELVPATAIS